MSDDRHQYDDIINLPHHQSASRPHMSDTDRAAQFAPFAALTGHGAAILETAQEQMKRITENEQKVMMGDGEVITVKEIYEVERIKKEKNK
ncbi:MAG: hypothetical protein PHW34_15355 [Hespellia sp.]|nr:hypothetical protein [Hespellia sp.]